MGTNTNHFTSSDSSSSSSSPSWDVFLSFHGEDTRHTFTSHLYFVLDQAAILTYRDDPELEKGQNISSGLLNAIRDSKASIVVLSQNYASSSWCLEELVEILACNKTKGLLVRPVFYHVNPSDVRQQKANFGEALVTHRKRYDEDKIEGWRAALTEIANRSGYHIEKDGNKYESDVIQQILKDIAPLVSTKSLPLGHLVGVDSAVEEIYEKLSMHSNDVRAIGICGMGGIGKTTIAKAFYNKFHDRFHRSCFVDDVKEILRGPHGQLNLLKELLVQLTGMKVSNVLNIESGLRKLNDIFSSRKVLVVLDNFDELSDMEWLVQPANLFYPQSRIILTTRDQKLLRQLEIDTYMVKKLEENESLDLFTYHAFRRTIMSEDFKELSLSFVEYAAGLPLALKVLGSLLRCETVSFWKTKLKMLKTNPEHGIHAILKLSYDELSHWTVKAIFLDIVFFFLGDGKDDRDEAVCVFESCRFYPENGIPILVDKCLLTIEKNKFKMHDLIRDMGREVIRHESNEPGKSKRLFFEGSAFQLFKYQEGKDKVEGLIIDLSMWTRKYLGANIFETMPNLRLLEITNAPSDFKEKFENLFQALRCIRWHYCPWTQFSSGLLPQKLVSLDMQFSNFEKLSQGTMPSPDLKSINFSWSKCLKTTPNFGNLKSLEKLSFSGCRNLCKVHQSIVMLTNLSHLNLGECDNLKQLPEQLGNMKGLKILDANHTAIKQLPESICHLKQLDLLNLAGCTRLINLPEQIGKMEGLRNFDASESAIGQLPHSFEGLVNLVEVKLSSCKNLRTLPNICNLSYLEVLNLDHCSNLDRLPERLENMQSLKILRACYTAIEEIPDSVGQLSSLVYLDLEGCEKIRTMSSGIWNLTSFGDLKPTQWNRVQNLPNSIEKIQKLRWLSLRCNIRSCLPMILCFSSLEWLSLTDAGEGSSSMEQLSFYKLSNLGYLAIENCTSLGSSFPEFPLNLSWLTVRNNALLEHLPDLSSFICLTILVIGKCNRLRALPPLPLRLTRLEINDCPSLGNLLDLTTLKDLGSLRITNCGNLKFIVEESFFQVRKCSPFFAHVASTAEIPNWLSERRSGSKVSFNVPQMFIADNFLCTVIWIVYRCKSQKNLMIRAVITNKTDHTRYNHVLPQSTVHGVGSLITCVYADRSLVKYSSQDRIEVSLEQVKNSSGEYLKVSSKDVKVESCGIHLIYKPISASTSQIQT